MLIQAIYLVIYTSRKVALLLTHGLLRIFLAYYFYWHGSLTCEVRCVNAVDFHLTPPVRGVVVDRVSATTDFRKHFCGLLVRWRGRISNHSK